METIKTIRREFYLPSEVVSISGQEKGLYYDEKGNAYRSKSYGTKTNITGVHFQNVDPNSSDHDRIEKSYIRKPGKGEAVVQMTETRQYRQGRYKQLHREVNGRRISMKPLSERRESCAYTETIEDHMGIFEEIATSNSETRILDTSRGLDSNGDLYNKDRGTIYEARRELLDDGTVRLTLRRTVKQLNVRERYYEVVYSGGDEDITFQGKGDTEPKPFQDLTDDEKTEMQAMINEVRGMFGRRFGSIHINIPSDEDVAKIVDSSYFSDLSTRLKELRQGMIDESLVEMLEISAKEAIEHALIQRAAKEGEAK